MNRKLVVSLALLALAAGAAWQGWHQMGSAHAASACSAAAFKGTYGFTEQGAIGTATPQVGLGVLVADGAGGISGSDTFQIYGVGTQQMTFAGSYTVNADGTGSMTLNCAAPVTDNSLSATDTPAIALTTNYNFVIVNNQAELRAIRTENGTFVCTTFTRQ
jgi:hypothetical protein